MNSPRHESMSNATGYTRTLLSELARPLLGGVASAERRDSVLRPAALPEVRADGVLACDTTDGQRRGLVVEIQLHRDETKRERWPWYLALVEQILEAPAVLLVMAPDRDVRGWAELVVRDDPRLRERALVLGPEHVPLLTALPPPQRTASAAFWSVAMHLYETPDDELLRLALDPALPGLDAFESRKRYVELLLAVVPSHHGTRIEELIMEWQEQQWPRSPDGGLRTVAEELLDEGREEGRRESQAKTVAMARRLFLRSIKLTGMALSPAQQAIVEGCADPEQFEAWQERLLAGESLEAVLTAPKA